MFEPSSSFKNSDWILTIIDKQSLQKVGFGLKQSNNLLEYFQSVYCFIQKMTHIHSVASNLELIPAHK